MISGYDVFRIYQPLKYHFNGKYDFFKFKGKCPNVNAAVYKKRSDRVYFEMVGEKRTKQETFRFFVSNIANNRWINITDLHGMEADHVHKQWTARRLAMDYNFKDNVTNIDRLGRSWKEVLIGDSMIPPILGMYQQELVTPETIIILDVLFGMFSKWKPNLIVDDQLSSLRNYSCFLDIDKEEYKDRFKKALDFSVEV